MRGYKGFNPHFICREKQYCENTVFKEDCTPYVCWRGIHYCKSPVDVLKYYHLLSRKEHGTCYTEPNIFCAIEPLGKISEDTHNGKSATNKLKVLNRIPMREYIEVVNNYILTHKGSKDYKANNRDFTYLPLESGSLGFNTGDCVSLVAEGFVPHQIGNIGDHCDINTSTSSDMIVNCGDCAKIKTLGNNSAIYNEGFNATISALGDCTQITSIEENVKIKTTGSSCYIKNTGDNCFISCAGFGSLIKTTGKNVNIICTGDACEVSAGIGTTITLTNTDYKNNEVIINTFVIDGKEYKENVKYGIREGKVVEL